MIITISESDLKAALERIGDEHIMLGLFYDGEALHVPDAHVAWVQEAIAGEKPEFLEAAKERLKAAVDRSAEAERCKYITPGSGQAMTYQAKAIEAQRYADTGGNGEYPFMSKEVGITGDTLADVAGVVLGMHMQWQTIGGEIERARLSAKAQIDAAADEATARAVMPVWPAIA